MEEGLIRLPPLQDIVIQVDDLLVAVHQTVAESWERVDNPGHPGGDPKLGVDFTGDGSFVVEQAAPLIVKNPEHAGGRDLGGSDRVINPFPEQRIDQVPRVADEQRPVHDQPDGRHVAAAAIERQRMAVRLRHLQAGQPLLIADEPLEDSLRAGGPAAELRDADGQPLFLGKNPGVAARRRPQVDEHLPFAGIHRRLSDADLTLQRRHPVQASHGEQTLGDDAVRPIRADQDLRPVSSPVRGHFDALRRLEEPDGPFVLMHLSARPAGFLDQQMVEPVPHHHVGDRPGGLDEERFLASVGKLDAIDGVLNDRLEITV